MSIYRWCPALLLLIVANGAAPVAPLAHADALAAGEKPRLVLLVARYEQPHRDLIAMTLGWMCREAGVEFDVYYAADRKEGGLFSQHGSSLVGGHHAERIGRALSTYRTTVVRLGGVSVFESLLRNGAQKVVDAPAELPDLYATMAAELGIKLPAEAVAFEPASTIPQTALYPECVYRKALAVPLNLPAQQIAHLGQLGVKTVWTVSKADADTSAWKAMEIKPARDLSGKDPNFKVAQRYVDRAKGFDTMEPIVASYMLPFCIREDRLILSYAKRGPEADLRRDQMIKLTQGKGQTAAYGRWFGDPQLIPLAKLPQPMAYNVVEPMRHILTVFSRRPASLHQPAKSWVDLEPSDEQLRAWAKEGKILATWLLHSGELSHDDSVLGFLDWCAMTKQKIGSGVHWQRYHFDPDAVEPMHVPADEGGALGLAEPVLHSTGAGIMWESAGDPAKIAALMADSRKKIAAVAGERFAPRGVYCFGDHHAQEKNADKPGEAQVALWKAVKEAGFEYLVTSILPGTNRVLYRDGDFVVLNQTGKWHGASPFVRGDPATFQAVEKKLVEAGQPGWLIGAVDTPIHGSPIYTGRPYGGANPHPKINDFYDYVQKGGTTKKVISATPRTVARYARIVLDLQAKLSAGAGTQTPAPSVTVNAPTANAIDVKPSNTPPIARRAGEENMVLVEAEAFKDLGGWSVDQQFMDVMGSPFLLAHGLGKPVASARTTVTIPQPGTYRVWARTRDWTAPQAKVPGPGRFRVHLNGKPLEKVFGSEGDGTWQWHEGGTTELSAGEITLALEDLTGFEGRCDAVLLVKDAPAGYRPPSEGVAIADWRRRLSGLPGTPDDGGEYDLVVVGGGYAGTCAAIAAARLGLHVALVQDRPVLGGNASSEVRVGPIGKINLPPFPHNADIIKEIMAAPGAQQSSGGLRARPNDDGVRKLVEAEENITLFLEAHVNSAEKDGPRIAAVIACHIRTGREVRLRAKLFADCTGDATLGVAAGADWRMGREGRAEFGESFAPEKPDNQLLGITQYWWAKKTEQEAAFPACPWALNVTEESAEVSRPKWPPDFKQYAYVGGWNWESGFTRNPITEAEQVRDHNFRAIYGTWDFLKNRSPEKATYAKAELEWISYVLGKRESRRLMGDHILTQQDVEESRAYPDGVVTATWYFDLHFPHPENSRFFPGQEYRSIAYDDPNFRKFMPDAPGAYKPIQPYAIPLRCFYSRNVPNLFMAGRNVSATHVGLAPIRVQNTTAMMGTMVGRAAYLCRKLGVEPHGLYERHLSDLKRLLADPADR